MPAPHIIIIVLQLRVLFLQVAVHEVEMGAARRLICAYQISIRGPRIRIQISHDASPFWATNPAAPSCCRPHMPPLPPSTANTPHFVLPPPQRRKKGPSAAQLQHIKFIIQLASKSAIRIANYLSKFSLSRRYNLGAFFNREGCDLTLSCETRL